MTKRSIFSQQQQYLNDDGHHKGIKNHKTRSFNLNLEYAAKLDKWKLSDPHALLGH